MKSPVVVLDACALVPIRLATTLLWLAEAGLFQPLWSDRILDEVERNLPKRGVNPVQAKRRVSSMRRAFGAEALVDGFDDLIEQMTCDPKDRHVLAVAVHDEADALVTFNTKDFPVESAEPHGVEILRPDVFLLRLLHQRPAEVIDALESGTQDLHQPPETLTEWLAGLTATVPMFANLAADQLNRSGLRGASADVRLRD
ncbi:PIN domain-containing protein [Salana multivorans]